MEEEVVTRSRSGRSGSKPPEVVQAAEFTSGLQETVVKLTRIHKEMIISEGQVNEVTTSATMVAEQTYVQNDSTVETQNQQNMSQEITKSVNSQSAAKGQKQKKLKAQTGVNGSPTKKGKSLMVVRQDEGSVMSSKDSQLTTTSLSSGTRRTRVMQPTAVTPTKSTEDHARKFYEAVQRGEVDASHSVFMRFYKPLEEWWNYYPKTDNTYSPLSNCRYELAPGMLALPNLSRRSIHARGGGNIITSTSSTSRQRTLFSSEVDSDTDEWEQKSRRVVVQRHTSVWRRITSSIWTVITIFYVYTFGALLHASGRVLGMSDGENTSKVPLLLRPLMWLLSLARQLIKLETWILASLAKGQRRNLLLALLLLLLFAVPTYILYKGGPNDAEKDGIAGLLGWLADGITQALLLVQGIIATPLSWITSTSSYLVGLIVRFVSSCIHLVYTSAAWLISLIVSPITWLLLVIGSNQTEQSVAAKWHSNVEHEPVVVSTSNIERSVLDLDINALANKVMESALFQKWRDEIEAASKQTGSSLPSISQEILLLKQLIEKNNNEKSSFIQTLLGDIRNLRRQINLLQIQQQQSALSGKLCCDKFDDKIVAILAGVYDGGDTMTPADLAAHIKDKLAVLEDKIAKLSAEMAAFKVEEKLALPVHSTRSFSEDNNDILAIVKAALAKYDADKTNMVDYAFESSGGTILSTRCTENYDYRQGETFYFGLSWFSKEYRPNNPRTIIQPNVHPGECWAFKGATGYVVIELSAKIKITAVTMEHIPRSIAPNESIASAPRDFSILGLTTLKDPEPLLLGKFRYEDNGQPLQTFQVQVEHYSFRMVELQIESNHGHVEYTCIYRFRVHGVPDWS